MQQSVCLVDDDSELRRAMKQTLELAGLAVSAFPGAAEALAILSPLRISCEFLAQQAHRGLSVRPAEV